MTMHEQLYVYKTLRSSSF